MGLLSRESFLLLLTLSGDSLLLLNMGLPLLGGDLLPLEDDLLLRPPLLDLRLLEGLELPLLRDIDLFLRSLSSRFILKRIYFY